MAEIAPGPVAWFRRRGTVRVRTTAAAVVVVGLALGVGSAVVVETLRDTLTGDVRTATALRAEELAAAVEAGQTPVLAIGEDDEEFVQVIGADGAVLASSDNVDGLRALVRPSPGTSTEFDAPIGDDEFVASAAAVGAADDPPTIVVVGRSLDQVSDSTEAATGLLAVAGPVLLAVVGATTWVVVGRALAPVEAIRREVDAISSSELHRRVPVPGAEDEIGRLATTMNRMLGRLEEGQARQRRFVADASHELRSPIASIRQHAEVALAHPDRSSVPDLAENTLAEAARVQRLVEDLLLLARFDEQGVDLGSRPTDLDDVVFAEADRLRSASDLHIDTSRVSAGRVLGDEAALRRVLRNLGDNAARHAATTISLSLVVDGEVVVLTVDDDGPGIPPTERDRVFERFVRLDEARARDDGGSGLGLAIVAELVRAQRGTIEVGDSPLGGARFRLRFPAHSP